MTLPTHEEALEQAREGSPFSNSTMGEIWMERNCVHCVHDAPARRDDYGNGCPLLLVAFVGKTPAEWEPKGMGDYSCLHFRDEDDAPAPEPIPDSPGQLGLFEREEIR